MSNLLRRLVEDETMSRNDIEGASVFYGDWDSADITRERKLLFARLKRMECPISIAEICKQLRENRAILDMAPNFISALNNLTVLTTHRDETEAPDLNELETEFVSRSQMRRNKFKVQVQ